MLQIEKTRGERQLSGCIHLRTKGNLLVVCKVRCIMALYSEVPDLFCATISCVCTVLRTISNNIKFRC